MIRPTLVVIWGMPGAGKTTLGEMVCKHLRIPLFTTDVPGVAICASQIATHHSASKCLEMGVAATFALIRSQISYGISVVLDGAMATSTRWDEIRSIVSESNPRLIPVLLECPMDILLERIERRANEQQRVQSIRHSRQSLQALEALLIGTRETLEFSVSRIDSSAAPEKILDETLALIQPLE